MGQVSSSCGFLKAEVRNKQTFALSICSLDIDLYQLKSITLPLVLGDPTYNMLRKNRAKFEMQD